GECPVIEKISVFANEFDYPTNFLPGDEVIGYPFQPFLFEVWCWLPHMPRHCVNTLRGIVKCLANSTTTAIIAVRQVKPLEVGRERSMLREEDNILSNPFSDAHLGGSFTEAPCKPHYQSLRSLRAIAPAPCPAFKMGYPVPLLRESLTPICLLESPRV
ncbi:hypothetical protein AVEN_132987-1, partial [Araneus ventricosus]